MDVSGSQSTIYAVVMDKASILSAPVRLGPFDEGSIWPAIVAVLLVLAAIQSFALWTPKQRLVPGILIVGGSSKDEVRASRSRFVHDARSMVLEGYEKVSGSFTTAEGGADILSGKRWEVLPSKQSRRAIDAAYQVPGRPEERSGRQSRFCGDFLRGRQPSSRFEF